jgi:hypothetical protein
LEAFSESNEVDDIAFKKLGSPASKELCETESILMEIMEGENNAGANNATYRVLRVILENREISATI